MFSSLLFSFPLLTAVVMNVSSNEASVHVAKSVNLEIHQLCLEARDYAGCVQSLGWTSPRAGGAADLKESEQDETCFRGGSICVAKPGIDQLGLPKVVGWHYKYSPSTNVVEYWQMPPTRVPHKGQADRYVALNIVAHYYQQPISATPGYYKEITPKQKTCTPTYGGGTWVDGKWKQNPAGQKCTTTAAIKSWVPGTPAVPGGPRSRSWVQVFDCKDKTKAQYIGGRLKGNWPAMTNRDSIFCKNRSEFKASSMKL